MNLRVLHINNTDVIGGRFNGFALNHQLPIVGVESEQAVWMKASDDPKVWQMMSNPRWFAINSFIRRVEQRLSLQSLLYFGSIKLLFDRRLRKSNVLHLHLMHNHFFSLFILPILTRIRPAVWTIHDTWGMTGRCVQPLGCEGWKKNCGVCPDVRTHMWTREDRSRMAFWIKRVMYALSRFEVIVASAQMKKMAEQSPLVRRKRIHQIPFGLDTAFFKPREKTGSRKRFGLPDDAFVISFRINGGQYKGAEYLQEMLRRLDPSRLEKKLCVIAIELPGMLEEFKNKFEIVEYEWSDDPTFLIDMYNASDIFLMPSMADAFGMMAVEAMACGTPVIVFEGTALPGVVNAPHVGISVPRADAIALTEAVESLLNDPAKREERGRLSRQLVEDRYSLTNYLSSLKSVYQGVLKKWG